MASVRRYGHCPCPRCLVPKHELSQFGTPFDAAKPASHLRVDNRTRRREIQDVRRMIYKNKYSVDSKVVETVLKGNSRVPTSVSTLIHGL